MDVPDALAGQPRSGKDWRERLTGRKAFDRSAAESAIRRAYLAGGLLEPRRILWARGPAEAAQAIAFLLNPPRVMWRRALAVIAIGSMAWVGLALVLRHGLPATHPSPVTDAGLSLLLAGSALALAAGPRLPVLPGYPSRHAWSWGLVGLGALILLALALETFWLQHGAWASAETAGQSFALALAAAAGMLPGLFLCLRVRRAYAHLPDALRRLAPVSPVAQTLQRAQRAAWAPGRATGPGIHPEPSLLRAYRTAHADGFLRPVPHRLETVATATAVPRFRRVGMDRTFGRLGNQPDTGPDWQHLDWQPRVRASVGTFDTLSFPALGWAPPHLDGIVDTAHAAAFDGLPGPASVFAELAFRVDRLYPFQTVAVAVEPAIRLRLDADGRPHAPDGPALVWADGSAIHAWRGRLIDGDLVDPSLPLTVERINLEQEPGRRWVLIERYGLGRYMLEVGAEEVHSDETGRLYRLRQPRSEPIVAVRVVNHTAEPDGTFQEFWLRVPPAMTTARQAVAWTFGLREEEYAPVAQS